MMTKHSVRWLLSVVMLCGVALRPREARASCAGALTGTICHPAANYKGCYQDGSNRRLPYVLTSDNTFAYYGTAASVSPSACLAAAEAHGYPYAAMQTGSQCWAGYSAPVPGDLQPDTSCNTPCTYGASGQYCGAAWINSVYATGGCDYSVSCNGSSPTCAADTPLAQGTTCSNPGLYMGCYVDASPRWGVQLTTLPSYNVSECLSEAKARGYSYAGLQWHNQCWVSNTVPGTGNYPKAPETDCFTACTANGSNSGQYCGGNMRNDIYAVWAGNICSSALACNGSSNTCEPASDAALNPAPTAPTGVSTSPNSNQIAVSWSAVPNAYSYRLFYGTTASGVYSNSISPIFGTSYTLTGLTNGQNYYFAVTAGDICGGATSQVAYAAPGMPISSCMEITSPGCYSLATSIAGPPSKGCLYIHDTQNVTVSCNGFSITGQYIQPFTGSAYVNNANNVLLQNCTFNIGIAINQSTNTIVQNSNIYGGMFGSEAVWLTYGNHNTITGNVINPYPFASSSYSIVDDAVQVIDESFDTISNNNIQTGYDTGIENYGFMNDSIISSNSFSDSMAVANGRTTYTAMGGFYSSELSRNIITNNSYSTSDGSRMFVYYYSNGLCPDGNCLPDGGGYYFRDNYFTDNTYQSYGNGQFWGAIYNPPGLPSGTAIDVSNNYYCGNSFGPAPQMTGPTNPLLNYNGGTDVIDGFGNTCTADADSQAPYYPITCFSPGPAVNNPSFEVPALTAAPPWDYQYNPAGGTWTFTGTSGIARNGSAFNNATAPDGSQVAFIQETGSISQAVSVPANINYSVVVSAAQRWLTALQKVNVSVDGVVVGHFTPPSNNAYVAYASEVLWSGNSAGQHTVTFSGTSTVDATVFIDKVRIVQR